MDDSDAQLKNESAGEPPGWLNQANQYRNYLEMMAEIQLGHWIRGRVSPSDIVQETMLDATRDHQQFRGTNDAQFLAWLKAILFNNINTAVNQHVTAQKRSIKCEVPMERLRKMQQSSAAIDDILAAQASSPSQVSSRRELLVTIADCLAELDDDQRQVVMLRTLQAKSYVEVAELMNRSEAACRMLWIRAIKSLRDRFARLGLL